ncbi:MAG: extracellular solute-binding protein [Caldilineaceae bacterium]
MSSCSREFQGSYEETAQKVTAALRRPRTASDLSLLSDVWWFKFYLSQTIIPLDDLMNAERGCGRLPDSLINEGVRKGQHYWVPFARSTPLFYYNKEKWAAAGLPDRGPETWDEFMEWAPQLVEMDGDEMTTSAFAHPDGASYIAWLFQGVAWQFNGAYSDADFTMRMTDDATIEAGEFYKATVHDYKWAIPSKDITADFINGLTASGMMSTGSMGGIKTNATFEFGTAMLPEKYQFGCCTGGSGLSILSTTPEENRGPAMEYIAFASNPESTTFWAQQSGYMPVRKSALESDAMQAYFEEFLQFNICHRAVGADRRPGRRPGAFVPNGDQIIGGG